MPRPLKVSELSLYISQLVKTDPILTRLSIEGEVVNLYQGRQVYFDLRDEKSKISCLLFHPPSFDLKNGDYCIVEGSLTNYGKTNKIQIIVRKIEKKGLGDKLLALEERKRKLEKEGLFDPLKKKSLKKFPQKIGLISSQYGAVLHDFVRSVEKRFPLVTIYFSSANVQGTYAEEELIERLLELDHMNLDVLVLCRGGGSKEELDVFNQEKLVRTIASLSTPIVTAIGHQIDHSLADLASDLRASTPTEAGMLVVLDQEDLIFEIHEKLKSMESIIERKIYQHSSSLMSKRVFFESYHPKRIIDQRIYRIKLLKERIDHLFEKKYHVASWEVFDLYNQVMNLEGQLEKDEYYHLRSTYYDYKIQILDKVERKKQ